jgi:hypothetical protein
MLNFRVSTQFNPPIAPSPQRPHLVAASASRPLSAPTRKTRTLHIQQLPHSLPFQNRPNPRSFFSLQTLREKHPGVGVAFSPFKLFPALSGKYKPQRITLFHTPSHATSFKITLLHKTPGVGSTILISNSGIVHRSSRRTSHLSSATTIPRHRSLRSRQPDIECLPSRHLRESL